MNENDFRDYLFNNHKEDLFSLIVGRREPVQWTGEDFPPIRFLLQKKAEEKINRIIGELEGLVLIAKELRLERGSINPTRIDLFGNSTLTGLTIIELKKSKQTERQSFTELLAYSNYFCSIFPGLKETAMTSILIAPMESRTVKDAYVQELVSNSKNILALIPHQNGNKLTLEVFYPEESYYQWFENNILNDNSMICMTISFPLIEGWIDSDLESVEPGELPQYTIDALNNIANSIAHKLEAEEFHAIVYATQKWGEIAKEWFHPNTIVIVAINPFSSFRTSVHEGNICGNAETERLSQVQAIYDQLTDIGKELYWLEDMEASFHNNLIRIVRDQFEFCFLSGHKKERVDFEISESDWYAFKTNMLSSVCTHNLNIYLTGLLTEIHREYIKYVFEEGIDEIHYSDDLPLYGYLTLTQFLPIWEIFRVLGSWQNTEKKELST